MNELVSVIVRQHNEFRHLGRLFDSIRSQNHPSIEIIVVDSGSTDGSRELAAKYADRVIDIKPSDFTFGYSLNVGIRNSKGTKIAIVSAHTYPTTQSWLFSLIQPFRDEKVCLTYGRQIGDSSSNPAEVADFDRFFGPKARVQRAPDYFCNNANSAIRRELWEKHPFDEALSGLEDIAWARHFLDQQMHLVYVPEAEIVHIHNESSRQLQNRFYREALALRRMGLKLRRHVLADACRETLHFGKDLREWVRMDFKAEHLKKTAKYRYHKTVGHVKGVFQGRKDESGLASHLREILDVRDNLSVLVRGPNDVALVDCPVPAIAPTDVLIQPAYVGICGTDREIIAGHLGYYRNGMTDYPIVLGHEYSGVVARVGAKVTHLSPGDRVVGECILTCGHCSHCANHHRLECGDRREVGVLKTDGALASYVRVPGSRVHVLPKELSLQKAALTEPLAVVVRALKTAGLWEPLTAQPQVLLTGVGSLGLLAIKALMSRGFTKIHAIERSERKLSLLPSPITSSESLKAEDIQNADVVIDFSGSGQVLKQILGAIRAQSRLVLIGFPYEDAMLSPEKLVEKEVQVRGSLGSDSQDFKDALSLLPRLDVDVYLEQVYPIQAFAEAIDVSRNPELLKVMIAVHPNATDGLGGRAR